MAVLTDQNRKELWAEYMSDASALFESIGTTMLKADLRAIVDATDQWISDNKVSFNNALPNPGKTQLTSRQKTKIFMMVAAKRWEVE